MYHLIPIGIQLSIICYYQKGIVVNHIFVYIYNYNKGVYVLYFFKEMYFLLNKKKSLYVKFFKWFNLNIS